MTSPPRPAEQLSAYARNVTSQNGEDGIIERVLDVIEDTDGWCVEFGAWDGRTLSNTYNLIENRGYSAVLVEPNRRRFAELRRNHGANERVIPRNEYVGIHESDGLDRLLAPLPVPHDFDLLSIDVDGLDYYVWRAVRRYRPKVVVIEFNPSIPNALEFVQRADARDSHGASLRSLVALGRAKGYEPVAATVANLVFVRREFFSRFGIDDNSPSALRPEDQVAYVFQGFDGTLFVRGLHRLSWHGLPVNERRLQQLPRVLRKSPDRYSLPERVLFRVFRRYYAFRSVSGLADRERPDATD